MKVLQSFVICLFLSILILPILFFNFEVGAVSEIDNRKLAELDFNIEEDKTESIEKYINDRIGFRDDMITAYTILNDKLFNKMVHPSYTYGKNGYVFGLGVTTKESFSDFHVAYADLVKAVQTYCENRGVPFLFVFNPAKPAVYQDMISNGINYNRDWVKTFFSELDKRGINYLDNTVTLKKLRSNGIEGFNVKYDANHWNDTGAFYGSNEILKNIKIKTPNIHINNINEFNLSQIKKDSLLVSNFPIDEDVPLYSLKEQGYNNIASLYKSMKLDQQFGYFNYYVNAKRQNEGSPKCLVFQGSYMNSYGYKYFINAMGEYIAIHDYQNIINFPYYFNIFKPDCVVLEVAEYTLNNNYFNYEKMKQIDYNPIYTSCDYISLEINSNNIKIKNQNNSLTTLEYITENQYKYVWLDSGEIFDMEKSLTGYEVTVETSKIKELSSINVYAVLY